MSSLTGFLIADDYNANPNTNANAIIAREWEIESKQNSFSTFNFQFSTNFGLLRCDCHDSNV
jgi:hypothetical protein